MSRDLGHVTCEHVTSRTAWLAELQERELEGHPQEALVELPSALAESELDEGLLLAGMNAQLLEASAALGQRQEECDKMGREVQVYYSTFERMHEQQSVLYQNHVREVRKLSATLAAAEKRAEKAEAQHAEDLVRIESWATMADALEASSPEEQ